MHRYEGLNFTACWVNLKICTSTVVGITNIYFSFIPWTPRLLPLEHQIIPAIVILLWLLENFFYHLHTTVISSNMLQCRCIKIEKVNNFWQLNLTLYSQTLKLELNSLSTRIIFWPVAQITNSQIYIFYFALKFELNSSSTHDMWLCSRILRVNTNKRLIITC